MAKVTISVLLGSGADEPATSGKFKVRRIYEGLDGERLILSDWMEYALDDDPVDIEVTSGEIYESVEVEPRGRTRVWVAPATSTNYADLPDLVEIPDVGNILGDTLIDDVISNPQSQAYATLLQFVIDHPGPQGAPGVADDATMAAVAQDSTSAFAGAVSGMIPPLIQASVDNGAIPSATTAIKGLVELATPTEATTGTDAARAVTPAGVKAAIAAIPKPDTAAGPDLVTPMLAENQTMFFAHRGSHNLYPESSLEGVRATIKDGFAAEVDLRILSTGQPVLLHDATINRTMDGTGTVASMTLAQWRARRILPQIPGGQKALPVEWEQLITEVGGRGLLLPEINVIGSGAPMIDTVVKRGLQRAVIFQCDSIADMQEVRAAGCACLLLVPAVNPVLTSAYSGWNHAQVRAAGVEFIGYNITVTQSEVAAAVAAGLKVIIYTVNTHAELQTQLAKGVHGVFTDDPWHVSGRYAPRNEDPFRDGDVWPHLAGRDVAVGELTADQMATYIRFGPPGKLRSLAGTASKQIHVAMGWAGQARGPNLRVRFTATFLETAVEQGRFVGVFIGTQTSPDTVFADAALAGQNGYHFFARRTGVIAAYRVAPGVAPAALATSAAPGTPLAAANARSQPMRFEVNITATGVTFTNLTTGLSVTSTDTAYRGPCRIDFSTGGTDVEIEDIGVEEL